MQAAQDTPVSFLLVLILCSETFSFGREGKPLFISGPPSDWRTEDFDDEEDMFFDEDELDEGIKQVDASQYKVY